MKELKFYLTLVFLSVAILATAQSPVPFTAGNIVVYRVGDGSAALADIPTAVFLDEFTPAGVLVQSIAMPSATGNVLTSSGSTNTVGFLNLSIDGRYLVMAGYNQAVGTGSLNNANPKTIATVDYNGTVNTSTVITNYTIQPTSAMSDNGTNLWMGGGSGVAYTTLGSTTITSLNSTSGRDVNIANGQLYYSSSSSTNSIQAVGTGLPTTTGQISTHLPGTQLGGGHYQYVFADMDPNTPGIDVIYACVGGVGSIIKYSLVGGTWVSNGSVGGAADLYRGLTAKISGTTVILFATRQGPNSTGTGGEIVTLTDNTGYNVALAGTPSHVAYITDISGVTANTAAWRGMALVPQPPSVKVSIKAFLQGDYSTGLSRHKDVSSTWAAALNANSLSQPYNTAAFGNYAGTESVSAGFFTSTSDTTNIVDWVLLELRDATTPSTVIARRAAFIREDGRVVDLDGTSAVNFPNVNSGNYYVVVRHRTHLGIRSSSAIALSGTTTLYDFSTAESKAYQDGTITTNAAMQDVSGAGTVYGMWAGNANSNTTVRFTGLNNDAGVILSALGGNQAALLSSVYNNADLNMDGTVRYTGLNNDAGVLLSVLGSNQAAIYTQHL